MQEKGKKIEVGEGKERFFYFAFRAEILTLELLIRKVLFNLLSTYCFFGTLVP